MGISDFNVLVFTPDVTCLIRDKGGSGDHTGSHLLWRQSSYNTCYGGKPTQVT